MVYFIYCTYCIVYTLRSLQIRTFVSDPDLFCRIQTFFSYLDLRVESGLSCRIRTFLSDPDLHVGSEPCLSDPDLHVESGPFLLDLDHLVGTEPFFVGSGPSCRIRTYLSDPDLLVRSGPSCRIRTFLSDPDLLVRSGPSCRIWTYLSDPDLLVESGKKPDPTLKAILHRQKQSNSPQNV